MCITLCHLTGGLLAAGASCSDTGLKDRPYVSVTKKYSRDVISGDTSSEVTSGQVVTDPARSRPVAGSAGVASPMSGIRHVIV